MVCAVVCAPAPPSSCMRGPSRLVRVRVGVRVRVRVRVRVLRQSRRECGGIEVAHRGAGHLVRVRVRVRFRVRVGVRVGLGLGLGARV